MMPIAMAGWTFQDNENTATFHDDSYGGGSCSNSGNMVDDNFATYGIGVAPSGAAYAKCYYDITWNKPANTVGAKLEYKIAGIGNTNYTIPQTAWDYNANYLYTRIQSYGSQGNLNSLVAYSDGSYHNFDINSGGGAYESAIWWLSNDPPTTPSGSSLNSADQVGENLIATGSGSTDPDSYPDLGITYRYEFRCDSAGGSLLQAKSTDNSWVIDTNCAYGHTVYVNIWANDTINESTSYETETKVVVNSLPSTPSGSSLNAADQHGEELEATGSGSTDPDGSGVTYQYQFRCDSASGTVLQALSSDNTYTLNTNCNTSVYVRVYSNDGTANSASYETEFVDLVASAYSNVTEILQANNDFYININYSILTGTVYCGATDNSADVSCPEVSPSNYRANILCSLSGELSENVSIMPYCRTASYQTNATAANVSIDNVLPTVTVLEWNEGKYYFENNITGNFTLADSYALYSWNISIDGTEIDSDTNVEYDSYTYNLSIDPDTLSAGTHTMTIEVADGHTKKHIDDYNVKNGGWFDDSYLEFDTGKNKIKIQAKDKESDDVWTTEKKDDRYSFEFSGKKAKNEFEVETDQPLYIINKPNTKEKIWIISGNNWIDFENDGGAEVEITKINDKKATILINGKKDKIKFNSVGELNIVTQEYNFSTVNYTISYDAEVFEQEDTRINLTIDFGQSITYTAANASLIYNGTKYTSTKTSDATHLYYTKEVTAPSATDSFNQTFYWNITFNPTLEFDVNDTNVSANQTIIAIKLARCEDEPTWSPAINFTFVDEETLEPVAENISLNMDLDILSAGGVNKKYGFEFRNNTYYEICIENTGVSYTVNSRLEYYSDNYANRKYYLIDYPINTSLKNITLVAIDEAVISDIVITVYDQRDGSRIKDAYVKILRYYPNEYNESSAGYRTVEIELTDQNGQTSGKMILADVWYKFIVEYPAGTVLLNSDIQKILTTEVDLPVYRVTDYLSDFKTYQRVSGDVSCTKSTRTCRFTWSDSSGDVTKGELKIYEDTGFAKILNYTESIESNAATISYVIPNITNKRFIAEGWIYVET